MSLIRVCRGSIAYFGVGDLLVIVGFVLIGEFSHGVMPWTVPMQVAETVGTFLIGWAAVAPLSWAYQRENLSSPWSAAWTGVLSWVGASVIANLLRSTPLFHGNASVTFFLVTIVFGGAMFAVWRYLRVRSIVS